MKLDDDATDKMGYCKPCNETFLYWQWESHLAKLTHVDNHTKWYNDWYSRWTKKRQYN